MPSSKICEKSGVRIPLSPSFCLFVVRWRGCDGRGPFAPSPISRQARPRARESVRAFGAGARPRACNGGVGAGARRPQNSLLGSLSHLRARTQRQSSPSLLFFCTHTATEKLWPTIAKRPFFLLGGAVAAFFLAAPPVRRTTPAAASRLSPSFQQPSPASDQSRANPLVT